MFVYAVVLLCALGLAAMVYRYDMYEREPWYMLLLALAMGGAAGFGVGHLEDFAIALRMDQNLDTRVLLAEQVDVGWREHLMHAAMALPEQHFAAR